MFSQKRRFYEKKSFYLALIAALVAAGSFSLWMGGNFGDEEASGLSSQPQDETLLPGIPEDSQRPATADADDTPVYDNQPVSAAQDNHLPDTAAADTSESGMDASPGYLVVEEDGYIRIYQIDSLGGMKVLRTSDISFELLGQEDQLMFQQGIRLETEDQLMELLQDFES